MNEAICSEEALLDKIYEQERKSLCREFNISVSVLNSWDKDLNEQQRIAKKLVLSELDHFYNIAFEHLIFNPKDFSRWYNETINKGVIWGEYKKRYKGVISNKLIQSDILTDLELYRDLKLISRLEYLKQAKKEQKYFDKETIQHLEKRKSEIGKDYLIQARLLFNRNKSKLYRARKRIKAMIESDNLVLFMTLTNSDKYFERSNYQSRLLYAKRLLKKYACDYMLNTDYGKANGREHFHSVACFRSKNDYKAFCEAYRTHTESAIYNRHFGKTNRDCIKGARYISCLTLEKLAFHSVKDTTKHSRLIYCSNPDFNKRGRLMA